MAAVASTDDTEMSVASQSPTTNPILISCPVCQEDYEEPKLLPCAHRLCRKCLVEWITPNTGPPSCPVCHRSIKQDKKVSPQTKDSKDASSVEGGLMFAQQMGTAGDTSNSSTTNAAPVKSQTGLGKPAANEKSYTVFAAASVSILPSSVTVTEAISSKAMVDGTKSKRPRKTDSSNSKVRTTEQIPESTATAQISAGTSSKTAPLSNTTGASTSDDFAMQKKEASKATTEAQSSATPSTKRDNAIIALVDSLPTDVVLVAVMESTKKLRPPHVCSICQGDKVAFDLCLFCEEKLCQMCSVHHSRMAVTRHHEVQPIDKLTPTQLASNRRERCPQHPDQFLELYCPVHFQPTCFSCYPVRHGGCGAIETAADAATRQRQVVQKQMEKLTQASEDIRRHQQDITESQQKARKDVVALTDRLSTALRNMKDNLLAKVNRVSPNDGLQGTAVTEWNWLATAHQQLVTDTFVSSSDVNILHMSGALAARAARLSAEAPRPVSGTSVQLVVDEEEVKAVEEKLKALGTVVTPLTPVKRGESRAAGSGTSSVQQIAVTTASAAAVKCSKTAAFDPFTCENYKNGHYHYNNGWCLTTMCLIDDDRLLITDLRKTLTIVNTRERNSGRRLQDLRFTGRAMALVEDGVVAITTEANAIYFVHVNKSPVKRKEIFAEKGYRGIAPGLNNTLIVSFDGTPPSIDVISRSGQILKTLTPEVDGQRIVIGRPGHICRWGNHVVVVDIQNNRLLKIPCDADTSHPRQYGFSWLHHPAMKQINNITTDHAGRLYISIPGGPLVADVEGRWRRLSVYVVGDIAISGDGIMFVHSGSPDQTVDRHDLTKS